ncbi:MAG TPA: hypothetical protein PLJ42_00115 [Chitinophagales bacterium]|jgi:long-chain acyl-CoA synthetase|nr:hypothetical protein [Chitinophagales bacterium]HQW77803.1 hypothetical protein [Chitinophagales bacterium]HRB66285.1 hypothetical protein [Chitinophagales bacterium]HRB93229.1 hypothetical protein [Chitinophagales bacterium]
MKPHKTLISPKEKFFPFEIEKANHTFLRQAYQPHWIHFSWKRVGIASEVYLKNTGRRKELFKTDKGKYIALAPIALEISRNQLISPSCEVGNNLKQPQALVVLVESTTIDRKDIKQDLLHTLKEVNNKLDNHERIAKLVILQEACTIENNLITPTMKVKRNVLEEKYEADFLKWQNRKDEKIIWN